MSESGLRQLERRWKETGSVDDGAAWLKEGMRLQVVSRDRVGLAAHCGYEVALLVLADWTPPQLEPLRWWQRVFPGRRRRELYRWLEGLEPFGYEACKEAFGAAVDLLDPCEAGDRLGLSLVIISMSNVPTADSQLAAAGEVLDYLCVEGGFSPAKVRAHLSNRLIRWALQP
ncbi:MAG: hypothetical protein JKY65_26665 [Planctomycetes bacterium]|nr:hypothetical protein [Planctomycetota bacterium]